LSETYLIVGLGNPGKDYEYTRHNLGFLVVAHLAKQNKLKFSANIIRQGLTAHGNIFGKDVYLLLPSTYVNHSGRAIKELTAKQGIDLDKILVVSDDISLNFGQLRLRSGGSAGGHNGLTSIVEHLKTKDFNRLRLGIGLAKRKADVVDYVLGEFSREEKKKLGDFIQEASECCEAWLGQGLGIAMNQFNRRKDDE